MHCELYLQSKPIYLHLLKFTVGLIISSLPFPALSSSPLSGSHKRLVVCLSQSSQTLLCLLKQEALPLPHPLSSPAIDKPWKNRGMGRQTHESERINKHAGAERADVCSPADRGEGEGRGAVRGVPTDASVICTVWVSAVERKAVTETAAAAWDTFPSHERQQRRRAGWESWAAKQEEEVSKPYRKQERQKLLLKGREARRQIDSFFSRDLLWKTWLTAVTI